MSFLWLISHNVWSKKVRSLLTSLAVAIGVLTVVSLGIVTESLRTTAASVLEVGSADFTFVQRGLSDILESAITEGQLKQVQGVDGIKSAIGVLLDTEKLNADNPLVVEIGISPTDIAGFGIRINEGEPFGATAANEVMVGSRLAASLGVTVGSTIKAGGGEMKVVGIFTTGNVFGDSALMFPLIPFQAYERQPGGLSMIFAKVDKGQKIPVVQKRVEKEIPLLIGIKNLLEFGRADRSFQLITAADRAATIVAIVVGAVIVMNTMLLSLVERYREFGVLRAIGWSRRRLIALVGGEAAIIGFVGAIIGVGLAVGGTEILATLPSLKGVFHPKFEAWIFGRALLTAAALTLLGALYPAIRAARLAPLEALRRE